MAMSRTDTNKQQTHPFTCNCDGVVDTRIHKHTHIERKNGERNKYLAELSSQPNMRGVEQ